MWCKWATTKLGVVRLPVEGRERHHHARQPADDEDLHAGGDLATASNVAEKNPSEIAGNPVANTWWTRRSKLRNPIPTATS